MTSVLNDLEQVKAALVFAVRIGHKHVPVSGLMRIINKITGLLKHNMPLNYQPENDEDDVQAKSWTAIDDAHRKMFNLLVSRKKELLDYFGERNVGLLQHLMVEMPVVKKRFGSIKTQKRGRAFNVASIK